MSTLVFCAWFFGANHSTLEAWATLPRPPEGRLPYPTAGPGSEPEIDLDTLDWTEDTIADALGKPANAVESGAFLVTVVHVYDSDATPIRRARVVITLSSEAGSHSCIDYTNAQGSASCLRWIPADAQGQPMIVTAEATSSGWIGSSSKWFVPE